MEMQIQVLRPGLEDRLGADPNLCVAVTDPVFPPFASRAYQRSMLAIAV